MADAIDFCLHNHRPDLANHLYKSEWPKLPLLKSCLDKKVAMQLFSSLDDTANYYFFLSQFINQGGNSERIPGCTEESFYEKHIEEINKEITQGNRLNKQDNRLRKICAEFYKQDRFIRLDFNGPMEEKILLDSLNQVPMKQLLADTSRVDYGVVKSMELLLRHASPEYLKEFKNAGLLMFYASNGLTSLEKYFDAVAYVTNYNYFPYDDMSGEENRAALNERRVGVGMLPVEFSPLFFKKYDNEMNYPDRTQRDRDELCEGLLKYLEIDLPN